MGEPWVALEIELTEVATSGGCQLPDEPGLAHLPGAAENERLASFGVQPGLELGEKESFHIDILGNNALF